MHAPHALADKRAANNKMERELGWLADPLFFGDYPASNKLALGSDLPSFTPEQMAALKGSVDAIGVNVYTARSGASMCSMSSCMPVCS